MLSLTLYQVSNTPRAQRRNIISRSTVFLTAILVAGLFKGEVAMAQKIGLEFRQHPFLEFDIEENRSADVSLADMDNDGDLDVILANGRHWAQQNYVFLNAGDGKLLEALPLGRTKSASYTVQTGDLDNDGDVDAVVIRDMLPALSFVNDGHGSLTLSGEIPDSIGPARSAVLIDADDDGVLDLVVVTRRTPDRLYRGTSQGSFHNGVDLPDEGFGSTGVVGGDVDADGDVDLVIARRDGAASVVMLNDGEGTFRPVTLSGSEGDHRKAALADMDGDGRPDIVLVSTDGLHLLFLQNDKGVFQKQVPFGKKDEVVQALAVGDLDQDGDIDLVAGADGPNILYINDGSGKFIRQLIPSEADTYGVAVGDMNADSFPDIVFANSGSANEVVLTISPQDDVE